MANHECKGLFKSYGAEPAPDPYTHLTLPTNRDG